MYSDCNADLLKWIHLFKNHLVNEYYIVDLLPYQGQDWSQLSIFKEAAT